MERVGEVVASPDQEDCRSEEKRRVSARFARQCERRGLTLTEEEDGQFEVAAGRCPEHVRLEGNVVEVSKVFNAD